MRKFFITILFVSVLIYMTGCIRCAREYTLNHDGSGKVKIEAFYQPIKDRIGSDNERFKKSVKRILRRSSGVDVWKDITYKAVDNVTLLFSDTKTLLFNGTAYFNDIAKLRLNIDGIELIDYAFIKDNSDGMVLKCELKGSYFKENEKMEPHVKLEAKEIEERIKIGKAEYKRLEPLMKKFLKNLSLKDSFKFPGKLTDGLDFKKDENGAIVMHSFEGDNLFATISEKCADDNWWKEQVIAGADDITAVKQTLFKKIVLSKEAIVTGQLKSLFDYKSEVDIAKENFPKLLKELDITLRNHSNDETTPDSINKE